MTHLEDLDSDDFQEALHKARQILDFIAGGQAEVDMEVGLHDVLVMLQRLRINMFQISDHRTIIKGLACYIGISKVDHTCETIDDFALAFRGRQILLRCLRPMSVRGYEDVRINYLDPTTPFVKRQQHLKECYYFDCACTRCERESQDPARCDSGGDIPSDVSLELEQLYRESVTDKEWYRRGLRLLQKLYQVSGASSYIRDLLIQLQSTTNNLAMYEDSLGFGLKALSHTSLFSTGESVLYALCETMARLGWNRKSSENYDIFRKFLSLTCGLMRFIYGKGYAPVRELRNSCKAYQ
jgi:hypothetical protein